MTKKDFAPIMAYVATACSAPAPSRQQTEVYFDLLGDLEANVVQAAARMVVIDHVYPSLPPAGLIRKQALELKQPGVTGPDAWKLFHGAARKFGSGKRNHYGAGQVAQIDCEAEGLKSLPPRVARAARSFGWQTLCDTTDDALHFAREQFLRIYATIDNDEKHQAIMPPSVRSLAAALAGGFAIEGPAKALAGASAQ